MSFGRPSVRHASRLPVGQPCPDCLCAPFPTQVNGGRRPKLRQNDLHEFSAHQEALKGSLNFAAHVCLLEPVCSPFVRRLDWIANWTLKYTQGTRTDVKRRHVVPVLTQSTKPRVDARRSVEAQARREECLLGAHLLVLSTTSSTGSVSFGHFSFRCPVSKGAVRFNTVEESSLAVKISIQDIDSTGEIAMGVGVDATIDPSVNSFDVYEGTREDGLVGREESPQALPSVGGLPPASSPPKPPFLAEDTVVQ